MKQFSNTHLGAMSNVSTTLVMGGVRSFGKYFARTEMFYNEEVKRKSVRILGSHYGGWWSIVRISMLLLMVTLILIPVIPFWVPVLVGGITLTILVFLSLFTWLHHAGREVKPLANRYQNMLPLDRGFIQSEDSRHGGPFGRACFVSEGVIHEATPPSFMVCVLCVVCFVLCVLCVLSCVF